MDGYFKRVKKRLHRGSARADEAWLFDVEEPALPGAVPGAPDSPEIQSSGTEDSDDDLNEPVDIVPVEVPAEELAGEALNQSRWVVLWTDFTYTLETLKFIRRTKNRSTKLLISR